MDSKHVFHGDYIMVLYKKSEVFQLGFDQVFRPLLKATEAAGPMCLGEIDAHALLRRDGSIIVDAVHILTFHPRPVVRMLRADPAALLAARLKFAVLALADASVAVGWSDRAPSATRWGRPALAVMGQELAGICAGIVAAVIAGAA